MARDQVEFPVRHFTEPSLPHVCAWTGEPATDWEPLTVKNQIGAQWWLLLLGVFPLIIVRAVTVKQVTGYLPVATEAREERRATTRRAWGVDDLPSLIILGLASLTIVLWVVIAGGWSFMVIVAMPLLLLAFIPFIHARRRAPLVGPGYILPMIELDRHGGIITVLRASPQFVRGAREVARPQIYSAAGASSGEIPPAAPPSGFGRVDPAARSPSARSAPEGSGTAPEVRSWSVPSAEGASDDPSPWWSA